MSAQGMKTEQYRKPAFMTDAIIQEARTQARMELFGTPSTNVKYAESVMNELEAQGHIDRNCACSQ
jgi:hypothetical protein